MTPIRSRRYAACALVLICAISFLACVEAKRKSKQNFDVAPATSTAEDDIPDVHYLFQLIGKEMYSFVDCPKYRFYIYMMGYSLPDERTTIAALSTLSNVLYGCSILIGFLVFPRGTMLIWTLMTLYIGPAFILLFIGAHVALLVAFAMYPVTSVLCIWLWFFFTSQCAQVIGKYLGLDRDKDGDVDVLDLIHYLAQTKPGKYIGLEKLHDKLNKMSMDPFQAIHNRLDRIQKKMESESELLSKSIIGRNGEIRSTSEIQKNHSD
uniref:EF-hand domain-containing protein n=1 Tax=Minutocellus polymorphus TaxID=265543 RepID=A0A7S0ASG7_9STRA